jgi:hypothetical protein
MKLHHVLASLAALIALAGLSKAAPLYSENFDVDPSGNWTVNNNGAGTNAANFFFDYSTVGIPPAPHSAGTTRGLKLGANLNSATAPGSGNIPGITVSPTGELTIIVGPAGAFGKRKVTARCGDLVHHHTFDPYDQPAGGDSRTIEKNRP